MQQPEKFLLLDFIGSEWSFYSPSLSGSGIPCEPHDLRANSQSFPVSVLHEKVDHVIVSFDSHGKEFPRFDFRVGFCTGFGHEVLRPFPRIF